MNIQELNWENLKKNKNIYTSNTTPVKLVPKKVFLSKMSKINNDHIKELNQRKANIMSSQEDIEYRIYEEKYDQFINTRTKPKQTNNYNDLNEKNVHANSVKKFDLFSVADFPKKITTDLLNVTTNISVQQFQLNLYKQNPTKIKKINIAGNNIKVYNCYINNKLQYIEINFSSKTNISTKNLQLLQQVCNILAKNNIDYTLIKNSIFIAYINLANIKKLINFYICKNCIRFIDCKFQLLTCIFYKRLNNAIEIKLQNNNCIEQIIIYQWNNFTDILNQLQQLSDKFYFCTNVILNYAICNHYNR